jgi:hypothetical protein
VYPNVNINNGIVASRECIMQPIKHPNAHQISCEVCEIRGLIEIKQGENLTVLNVPPGRIEVEYTTAQ